MSYLRVEVDLPRVIDLLRAERDALKLELESSRQAERTTADQRDMELSARTEAEKQRDSLLRLCEEMRSMLQLIHEDCPDEDCPVCVLTPDLLRRANEVLGKAQG